MPPSYKINKPILSSITSVLQRQTSKPSTKSLIWSDMLKQTEIINCKNGKKNDGTHSEVCQYEMFKMWITIVKLLKERNKHVEIEDVNLEQLSYYQAKQLSIDYKKAKLIFYKCFKEKNLGQWLTAPLEQNCFFLSSSNQQ